MLAVEALNGTRARHGGLADKQADLLGTGASTGIKRRNGLEAIDAASSLLSASRWATSASDSPGSTIPATNSSIHGLSSPRIAPP